MSFFSRVFSADYRAALAAEAAGDLELAAERYALAGQPAAAARMHLERAKRAETHAGQITALRDAHRWAESDPTLYRAACRDLGHALIARSQAEGIATDRDRSRVAEAARFLQDAEEWLPAGQAWESIAELQQAAQAYSRGGLVDRLEEVLARDGERSRLERELREAFADYQMHMKSGRRDAAGEALRRCIDAADRKAEYRRLLDQLEANLITGYKLTVRARGIAPVHVSAGPTLVLGRDPVCDLPLRANGISRRHAEIHIDETPAGTTYRLHDANSRNGTRIGGMPIADNVALHGAGSFQLGDQCGLAYEVRDGLLLVRVACGLDLGTTLIAGAQSSAFSLGAANLPLAFSFIDGKPTICVERRNALELNGESIVSGTVQLIRGDHLRLEREEFEIS